MYSSVRSIFSQATTGVIDTSVGSGSHRGGNGGYGGDNGSAAAFRDYRCAGRVRTALPLRTGGRRSHGRFLQTPHPAAGHPDPAGMPTRGSETLSPASGLRCPAQRDHNPSPPGRRLRPESGPGGDAGVAGVGATHASPLRKGGVRVQVGLLHPPRPGRRPPLLPWEGRRPEGTSPLGGSMAVQGADPERRGSDGEHAVTTPWNGTWPA